MFLPGRSFDGDHFQMSRHAFQSDLVCECWNASILSLQSFQEQNHHIYVE